MAKEKKKSDAKKNNTLSFGKAKKKARFKKYVKVLRIPLALFLVIVIAITAFALAGETRRSNLTDSFLAIPNTLGDSVGYPYSSCDLSLEKLMIVGDKPMLISEDCVRVLSQDADLLHEVYTDWADTKAFSQNGRAVIYSNTSNKLSLISRTSTLANFEEEGVISVATVGNNGSVALATTSNKVQSIVKVYSPNKKNTFQWNCSRDYVSSLSLSNSGKKVLISAIGVDNAQIYSRVILFDTKNTEPTFDKTFKETSILKVNYASYNRFVAIGDNKTIILDRDGEIVQEIKYGDNSLYAIDTDHSGNTLLCYKESGGAKIKIVKITSGGSLKEFELNYSPTCVDLKGSQIAVALDNTVTIFSSQGKERKKYECKNNVSTVLITSTGIFTLESGNICKY